MDGLILTVLVNLIEGRGSGDLDKFLTRLTMM